jgi:peptide chain release factor subunit 1
MLLTEHLERLVQFEPSDFPVLSLYLNTQPDQTGRKNFEPFLRKELTTRVKTFAHATPERESLEKDVERIEKYLREDLKPSTIGVAIFACSAADLFEAVQLEAPIEENEIYIAHHPHLYPLARVTRDYPRYAALLVNTNSARLFVFAAGGVTEREEQVKGQKTRRSSQGGWSQARYQRHTENFHLHHVKDVVELLEKIVAAEHIDHIIIVGEETVLPLVREQLPKHLEEKVVDVVRLNPAAPEQEVLTAALESLRDREEETEREKVEAAIGAFRAGGLGVVGMRGTLTALTNGQVDELLISGSLDELKVTNTDVDKSLVQEAARAEDSSGDDEERLTKVVADELIAKANQTAARVTFVQDPALLAQVGGVAAMLRFRI